MDNKEIVTKAQDHQCPNCSAKLVFSPKIGKFKCDYCLSEYTLDELTNSTHNASIANDSDTIIDDNDTYVLYTCSNCGAEIVADEEVVSTFCVYCGNTAILKNKLVGKFKPDYIIPFKLEEKVAKEKFREISKGRIFCPKDFTSDENIEKIRGVYIPFWLYNVTIDGEVSFTGETHTYWSDSRYNYDKTNIYHVERKAKIGYNRIPVDSSTRFKNDLMNSIEPFDYKNLVPYNHAYLSGFLAEKYDVEKEDTFDEIKKRAINSTKDNIYMTTTSYMMKRNEKENYEIFTEKIEYALLPVYMVNVKYNNELYTFAMNGESGKFIGDIPLDKKKVLIYRVISFLIVFISILIIEYIIYLIVRSGY